MRMKKLIAAALVAMSSSAHAEAKHVKFTTPIIIDGQPLVNDIKCPVIPGDPDIEKSNPKDPKAFAHRDCQIPFTVGELAYYALESAPVQGQPAQNWTDAIKRDELAKAIHGADDFTLLDDQRTSIETALAPRWVPSVLGFIAHVIDPPAPVAKTN